MAKKKVKTSKKKASPQKPQKFKFTRQHYIAIAAILAITALVFLPSLQNDFVNWDDDKNFYENPVVMNSNSFAKLIKNTPEIFSSQVIGNYNPLTIWTFALENVLFGFEKPFYWHLNNLFLHLFCVFIVFRIALLLGLNLWASVICALLFGIHPMRVESVAWVTERKDVLFGAFYLTALLYYVKGIKVKKPDKHRVLILVLFILSGLSKIQAVTLPLSMLAIDYFLGRRLEWKRIIEKWPYFAVSLFLGLLGVYFLQEQGSLGSVKDYALYDRLFIGSFSYLVYFFKLIIPYPLLPLYPYPPSLDAKFYLSIIPALGIIGFTYWAYLKEWKGLVFGLAFFTFNIMFLLQILGAGQGFLADRFTYIAYFGFFFAICYYLQKLYTNQRRGQVINLGVAAYLVTMAYITYQQCKIWKNSGTLWTHELKYYDNTRLPWGNRANYYRDIGRRTQALQDYGRAIALDPNMPDPLNSRGKLFFMSNSIDTINMALRDYTAAINIDPDFAEYHMNRGATYARLQNYNAAIQDLNRANQLDPNNTTIYLNRSIVYHNMRQYERELEDINRYLQLDANNGNMWANRANSKMLLGRYNTALGDINQAIAINPNAGVYYYYRAQYYYNTGNANAAQEDINRARQLGFAFNGGLEDLRM